MEQRADRTAHAMDDRYRGIVEGDPGFQRRQRHLDPGFLIVAMLIGIFQILILYYYFKINLFIINTHKKSFPPILIAIN